MGGAENKKSRAEGLGHFYKYAIPTGVNEVRKRSNLHIRIRERRVPFKRSVVLRSPQTNISGETGKDLCPCALHEVWLKVDESCRLM